MADIDKLVVQITSDSTSAVGGVEALYDSLSKLKTATSGGMGLKSIASGLEGVRDAVDNMGNITNRLNGLSRAVKSLNELGNIKVSASIGNQIKNINDAIKNIDTSGYLPKVEELVSALNPLLTMGKSNLGSTLTPLRKLPETFQALNSVDIGAFSEKIKELTVALRPLADEMQKVANGFSSFPKKLQQMISGNGMGNIAKGSVGLSYTDFFSKARMAYQSIKMVITGIGKSVNLMNEYIEDVNLFTVSMGEYADEAQSYAERVSEIMGIDPGQWLRNQGVFMTLATGFGIVSDRAYTMSKNLVQLGYDLSSFFNISVEDAMLKLQSGIAGELEPLRRIGYDLSNARLKQEAYTLGIKKKISAMTQAEKAELRYYAIMTQVTSAHGDMARTLSAPSNQLRILQAQFTQAGRAIGSIFIPMLNMALPYIIAAAKVVRILASTIASTFGFELPEVDYSGASDSVDQLGSGLENASDAAEKLKKNVLGFDELNILEPKDSDALDGLGSSGLGFELPEYDFLSDAIDTKVDGIMKKLEPMITWLKDNLDHILDTVISIGVGLLAWKVTSEFSNIVSSIKNGDFNKIATGITLTVTGFTLEFLGSYDLGKGDVSLSNIIKTVLGAALGVAGSLLVFGTGPLGWTVGLGVAFTLAITGITLGKHDKALEDDLNERFGEYELSDSEIAEWASKLTTSELSVKLDLYVDEVAAVSEAKKQLDSAIADLNMYNFKIQCGIDVSKAEYESAIDDVIDSAQTYIGKKQLSAQLALDVIYDGSATGNRLSAFVNDFYGGQSAKLTELGTKLKNAISTGFVDGEWIPDKLQEAIELQKEIQAILDYMSDVEFKAKMAALKLDASNTELTADSFGKLLESAQTTIEENMKNLEGVRLEAIKVAQMEYDQNILNGMSEEAAKQIYDSAVAEADAKFREGKLELTFGTMDFGIEVIKDAYSTELALAVPFFQQTTQELFTQGTLCLLPQDAYDNIDVLYDQMHDAYVAGLQDLDISKEARENIGKLIDQLKPTEEQYLKLAKESLATGQAVPKKVSEGLNDVNMLKAISGDMEAINYMIGQKLSTDTTFLETLATAKGAGKDLGEQVGLGLLANTQVIEDAANGTITLVNDTIGSKVIEITPTLVKNLEDLGINLSEGLLKGADSKIKSDEKSWKDWAIWPWNWFKDVNKINSPSRLFYEGGEYLAEGLFGGASDKLKGDKSSWLDWAIWPWNWFEDKNEISGGKSSVFSKGGKYLAEGLFGGAFNKLKGDKSSWTDWSIWPWNWFEAKNEISGGKSGVFSKGGKNLAEGLFGGASDKLTADKTSWTDWSIWPWNWFEAKNEISGGKSGVFSKGGKNIADGLLDGVTTNIKQNDYDGVFGKLKTWFNSLFGTNGSKNSSVFSSFGKLLAGGLKDGVDGGVVKSTYDTIFGRVGDSLSSIKSTIVNTINSIIGFFEKMANGAIDGVNALVRKLNTFSIDVPDWITDMTGMDKFGFNLPELSHVSLPRVQLKAEGGFVDRGEMFIAREAGAEMVGAIGRRTAVANNDQIVEGIASGVAEANHESNTLLREQNTLLRALLEKESGLYLDGKRLTDSVESYQRSRGRVLVSGGAV